MARIEDLLKAIPDTDLRSQLEAEVSALKKRTRFGLVYERHIPETVIARDTDGLRVGDHVRRKEDLEEGPDYRVTRIDGSRLTLLSPEKSASTLEANLKDVVMIRPLGKPTDVGLVSLGSVTRSAQRPYHMVIEGENFHALQLLTFAYDGKVDCIFIDPPYNTGARDWKYNNRFVDETDAWRHSKWLAMMERRLRLAKRLLKTDGVLIVTIDEHEVHHLGMLLEELFPTYLRYLVTIVISARGNFKANFSRVEEYAFFCCPDIGEDVVKGAKVDYLPSSDQIEFDPFEDDLDEEGTTEEVDASEDEEYEFRHARRRGPDSRRQDRPNMFYPILIDEKERRVAGVGPPIQLAEKPNFDLIEGLRPVWPQSKLDRPSSSEPVRRGR